MHKYKINLHSLFLIDMSIYISILGDAVNVYTCTFNVNQISIDTVDSKIDENCCKQKI